MESQDGQENTLEGIRPEDYASITEGYLLHVWKKTLFVVVMVVVSLVLALTTLRIGDSGLTYLDIIRTIIFKEDKVMVWTVFDWRLPTIMAAILCGCALSLAGAVMQGILRNPMASPFTLGLSNASAFGAAVGFTLLGGGRMSAQYISDPYLVTFSAFSFAMVATGVTLLLIKFINAKPETIVLAGIAVGSIFSSGLAFLQYFADEATLASMVFWTFGSLTKVSWDHLSILAVILIISFLYFLFKRWDYNAMESGDDMARGLGVNVEKTRIFGLVVSALLTAVVVSFMGVIGFIGLVGPHIVKRMIGNDYRYLLFGAMALGSTVMLVSNIFASHIFAFIMGTVVPVGIVTSTIGGPVFIAILIGRRKSSC